MSDNRIGKRRRNKKKVKLNLVFDEEKRKDFLTGFRKRNLERREKAAQKFQLRLKEERKRIKQEAKKSFEKLVATRRDIPELEKILSREFDTAEATVKIVELSTDDILGRDTRIGSNAPPPPPESPEEDSGSEDEEDELPGMGGTERIHRDPIVDADSAAPGNISKKEVQKIVKKQASQLVKNSKTFKMKNKIEQIKTKKRNSRLQKQKVKVSSKRTKAKHRSHRNRKT